MSRRWKGLLVAGCALLGGGGLAFHVFDGPRRIAVASQPRKAPKLSEGATKEHAEALFREVFDKGE